MNYDQWLTCVKINPYVIPYMNDESLITHEVIATAISLNQFVYKLIPNFKVDYDLCMWLYRIGGMGVFYKLYDIIDLDDTVVKQAIEDARHEEIIEAYQAYCLEREIPESIDGWSIFRDLFNDKREILEMVKGISNYHTYTLCRELRDSDKISVASYSIDGDKLSTDFVNIAKSIIEKFETGDKNDY